jgi:hypothetical protein
VGVVLAVARRADLDLAIALAEEADAPRSWLGLGTTQPGSIRLIVVRGSASVDSLLRGRAPAWGAGFALPGARTIVVRADKGDPRQTLRHELAHFALHDAIKVRVPLWFLEGYAAIAAGEWNRLVGLRLNLTVARGRIPDFFELDRGLRGAESTAEAAYALAASAVAMIARRHPEQTLAPLLDRLRAGESFDTALLASTGSTLGRFEVEWQRDVRKRYGVLGWFMAGGLWLVVAVGVLLAAWLRRRRDRPRRAALDEGWIVEPDEPPPDEPPRLDRSAPAP